MSTTIKEALGKAAVRLREAGCASPRLDAELLLAHVLGVERILFYAHPETALSGEQEEAFISLAARRASREPVAYITGTKEFMGLEFSVGPGTLIPRPESETVVEAALKLVAEKDNPSVLDLCCGSGALGIALKHMLNGKAGLTLSDVSPQALSYARRNLKKMDMEGQTVEGDLFENVFNSYDIIMANPPYIARAQMDFLQEEIRKYEPHIALCGGSSGYLYYDKIIKQSGAYLKEGSPLVFEVGDGQAEGVSRRLRQAGFKEVRTENDLLGIGRCVYGFYSKDPLR